MKSDIICVNETHLKATQTNALEGYRFSSHNRMLTHVNAPKGSGGVGIFVKNCLFDDFRVDVIDKSYDGILGLSFTAKSTNYKIIVYSVYLPPENSPWGRNATDFYAHLLGQIYLLSDCEAIFVCGDNNSRIGELQDIISDIDGIPLRKCIDKSVNQHGQTFVDFLIDSKMCVLNGRFNEDRNTFTSGSVRGKSVADYVCVPRDCFNACNNFEVISPASILDKHNLKSLIGERSKLPDHYILRFTYNYSTAITDETNNPANQQSRPPFNTRIYKLKRIPDDFLSSNLAKTAFRNLIRNIELCRENQHNIDLIYDQFCNTLIKEMNEHIPSFDCSKKTRKRYKSFKPYWDDDIEQLWQAVCISERNFMRFHGDRRTRLRLQSEFTETRRLFDKQLRRAERAYKRNLSIDIESICTNDPRAFWDHIKNLGPKRKPSTPLEVYDDNGDIIHDSEFVFKKMVLGF
jgi:hypothetical protein